MENAQAIETAPATAAGQNAALGEDKQFRLGINVLVKSGYNGIDPRLSAFAFRRGATTVREDDVCFYGNRKIAAGAVELDSDLMELGYSGFEDFIDFNFGTMPEDIERVLVCVSIEGVGDQPSSPICALHHIRVLLENLDGSTRYDGTCTGMGDDPSHGLISLVEFRKVKGQWRYCVDGTTCEGGLAEMCVRNGLSVG